MKRRQFLSVTSSAVLASALAALAQSDRVRRIAIMNTTAEKDPEGQARISSFRRSLQDLGWTESRNLRIDYRWGAGDPARAQAIADELLTLRPELIVANGSAALSALHQKTSIPVVFVVVVDPVGGGFVRTLARPGGTVTGFSTFEPEIGGKWLELLMKIRPGIRRVAGILDPDFRGFARVWSAVESLGPKHDLKISTLAFRNPGDGIESAVGTFAQSAAAGLIVLPTAINNLHRDRIIGAAGRHRLPAIYPFALYARSGGLASYGIDTVDLFRRSASYVDRILKGEKPADLPVQAPTKYELVINLRTAKALGIAIPPSLQLQADELIQ
jgi:putative tryptophan/tyrosine transport system substrate-binding protein